jgi:hypothetical protein
MSRIVLTIAVAAALLLPQAARAERVPVQQPMSVELADTSTEQLLLIVAGAAIGALLVHVAAPSELGAITGGLLGGIAANWWYRHGGEAQVRAFLKAPAATDPDLPVLKPRPLRDAALRR